MRSINEMKFHIGQKVRIYPSYAQKRIIAKSDGIERYVYNKLVALHEERYRLQQVNVYCEPVENRLRFINTLLSSKKELCNLIPFVDDPEIDSLAIDNAYINYRAAWNNYIKNPAAGIPVFHKKGHDKAYHTNPHYKKDARYISDCNARILDDHHIQLPKLGRIRFAGSDMFRSIMYSTTESRIGRVTISMDSVGRYYASFQIGSNEPFYQDLPKTGKSAGYDLGIRRLYTDSDGRFETLPDYYKRAMGKLAKEQRKLSRRATRAKKDGRRLSESKNYQKQRVRVALIHARTANQRKDFLNVISKREVKNHDALFMEDVSSKDLLMRYANMGKEYGHNFSRALADKSWGIFTTMLCYKAEFYGRKFAKVDASDTTNTCSSCGYLADLSITDREWICPVCDAKHDRDRNAAVNILRRGTTSGAGMATHL